MRDNWLCLLLDHKIALRLPRELAGLRLSRNELERYFERRPEYRAIVAHCMRCGAKP